MRKSFRFVAASLGLFLAAANSADADSYEGPGFSGAVWMSEDGSQLDHMGAIHVGETGFLMNMQAQGQRISSLFKWESETVWSIMHDQKVYMEIPPEKSGWQRYEAGPCFGFTDSKQLGTETVNGRSAEKWRCTGQTMVPGGEPPSDATVWYDPELQFGIKTVADNGSVFEIRDIEVGKQDPSIFEIPPGYQKFDLNAMMQQMMQQGQQ